MGQNDTSHLDMSTVFAVFKPTVNFLLFSEGWVLMEVWLPDGISV